MTEVTKPMLVYKMAAENVAEGKGYAFAGTAAGGLGVVIEGEPGYYPVPESFFSRATYAEASDYAENLNKFIGLDEEKALLMVLGSMKEEIKS